MTGHELASGAEQSRRAALGLLGTAPLAASGWLAGAGTAHAAELNPFRSGGQPDVRPGGSYDRFIAKLAAEDKFSGTVLLAHRGRAVLARSYGMADKELRIPNRVDTIFPLGSGSKPFTTLSILQLVQQQKVKLTEPVGTYLRGYHPETAKHVTVHHLLTHTSGLTDYQQGDLPPQKTYNSVAAQMKDLRAFLQALKPKKTPGTEASYSSYGMDILGEIVAAVSKQTFWKYVHDHIFVPAGMTSSAYYTRTEWLKDRRIAHPYMLQEKGPRLDALRNLDKGGLPVPGTQIPGGLNSCRDFIGTGGGNGFSTAPDMVRFAQAVLANKVLKPAYNRLFVNAKVPVAPSSNTIPDPASKGSFMGYGPVCGIFNDQALISHAGGITGASTSWTIYLDIDWCGVVLANYDWAPGAGSMPEIINKERHAVTDHLS